MAAPAPDARQQSLLRALAAAPQPASAADERVRHTEIAAVLTRPSMFAMFAAAQREAPPPSAARLRLAFMAEFVGGHAAQPR
jgi:hypothetical protein